MITGAFRGTKVLLGLLLGGALCAMTDSGFAQSSGRPPSPWMLWSGDSGSDDWEKARRIAHVSEARPLMEALSRRSRDSEGSARAAYWLGLFHYGSGDPATAATYFDLAAAGEDREVARQATVWKEQCRQILGDPSSEPDVTSDGEIGDVFDVREAVMGGDALVRAGRPLDALRTYLALEADARRLACLSWIYYRVGLIVVASRGSSGGEGERVDEKTLRTWEEDVAKSPERALVAKLRRAPQGDTPKRASETLFAEPVVDGSPTAVSPSGPGEFPDSLFRSEMEIDDGEEETERTASSESFYALQLGAFHDRASARRAMEDLTVRGLSVRLEEKTDPEGERLHLIWLGRCESREQARVLADRLLQGIEYQIVMGRP